MATATRPQLSVVPDKPKNREGLLREVLAGLSVDTIDNVRAALLARHRQDRKHGRVGKHPQSWASVLSEWSGKLAEAANHDDRARVLECAVEVTAIGLEILELRFDEAEGLDSPPPANLLASLPVDDPELDAEDWHDDADDEGIACTCGHETDEPCLVHSEMGGEG